MRIHRLEDEWGYFITVMVRWCVLVEIQDSNTKTTLALQIPQARFCLETDSDTRPMLTIK